MVLDEFLLNISSHFNNSGVAKAIAGIAGITGAIAGVNAGFESITKKFSELSIKAQATGDNMQDIQKWLNAGASSALTNFDSVKNALTSLQNQILTARQTGQIPIGFQIAGVSASASPIQALEQLRERFSKLSTSKGLFLAEQAGLKDLYPLLRLTKEEFDKLSTAPVLSNKQLQEVFNATHELRKLKNTIVSFKDQLFSSLAPIMEFIFQLLNTGLSVIFPIITGEVARISSFLRVLVEDLKISFKWLKEHENIAKILLVILGSVAIKFGLLTRLLKGFELIGRGVVLVLSQIAKHPVIFGLTLIALIAEDIFRLFKGDKSVIGLVFEKAKEKLEPFINILKKVGAFMKEFISFYVDIWRTIGTGIYDFVITAFNKVLSVIDKVKNAFSSIANLFSTKKDIALTQEQDITQRSFTEPAINFGSFTKTIPNQNTYNNNTSNNKNMSFGNIIINASGNMDKKQMTQIGFDLQKQIKTATYGL